MLDRKRSKRTGQKAKNTVHGHEAFLERLSSAEQKHEQCQRELAHHQKHGCHVFG
jgi:hypothetical protein